ncbi:MAG: hypothetical protein R3F59_04860 [Myxococcota bacterium]
MWLWAAVVGEASAGVWVRDAGDAYVQAGLSHAWADRMYLAGGRAVPQANPALLGQLAPLFDRAAFSTTDLSAYGELGLGHGLELSAAVPLRYAERRWSFASDWPDLRNHGVGLGDLAVGLRLGKVAGGWAGSGGLVARAPLYDNSPEALRVEAGNSDLADDRVPLGQGTYELEATAGGGRGFGKGWALVEAGLRARNRHFSLVVPGRVQVGVKPVAPVAAWVGADWAVSLGNGEAPDVFRDRWGKGPLVVDDQRSLAVSLGGSVEVAEGISVLATGARTVAGSRYPVLTTLGLGVSVVRSVRRGP